MTRRELVHSPDLEVSTRSEMRNPGAGLKAVPDNWQTKALRHAQDTCPHKTGTLCGFLSKEAEILCPCLAVYSDLLEPGTTRSLSTLKTPGAELACMPAMALSVSLLTTP